MSRSRKIFGVVIALLLWSVAIAGIFYFVGQKAAYDRMEEVTTAYDFQTFYATISEVQGNTLKVDGMDVNDINFRGEFTFSVLEETKITWRYTDISLEDLDVGDNIAITFTGEIMESYPAQLAQVTAIQLLDDEK